MIIGLWYIVSSSEYQHKDYNIFVYTGTINTTNTTTIEHTMSWHIQSQYTTIDHTITLQEDNQPLMTVVAHQIMTSSQTGQRQITHYTIPQYTGNHRLSIIWSQLLQTEHLNSIPISWLHYGDIIHNHWLLFDTFSLTGTYNNQFWEDTTFIIKIKIQCGLSQYILSSPNCWVDGAILYKLPLSINSTQRSIHGQLKKSFY